MTTLRLFAMLFVAALALAVTPAWPAATGPSRDTPPEFLVAAAEAALNGAPEPSLLPASRAD